MSAFTTQNTRKITLMGSHGQITADKRTGEIRIESFVGARPGVAGVVGAGGPDSETLKVGPQAASGSESVAEAYSGHAGGDAGLMADFTWRIRERRAGRPVEAARSSLEESLESHLVAFAAERARLSGKVEAL